MGYSDPMLMTIKFLILGLLISTSTFAEVQNAFNPKRFATINIINHFMKSCIQGSKYSQEQIFTFCACLADAIQEDQRILPHITNQNLQDPSTKIAMMTCNKQAGIYQ